MRHCIIVDCISVIVASDLLFMYMHAKEHLFLGVHVFVICVHVSRAQPQLNVAHASPHGTVALQRAILLCSYDHVSQSCVIIIVYNIRNWSACACHSHVELNVITQIRHRLPKWNDPREDINKCHHCHIRATTQQW